jgi:hypothetical protein
MELSEAFEAQDYHEGSVELGALLGGAEKRRFVEGKVQSEQGRERVVLKPRSLVPNFCTDGVSVEHLQERLLGVQSGGDKSLGADGFSTRQSNTRDPSTTD